MQMWYVQYADGMETISPQDLAAKASTVLMPEVRKQDPDAILREVRILPKTAGFKIEHPNWQSMRLPDGTLTIIDKRTKTQVQTLGPDGKLLIGWLVIIIIGILIATYFIAQEYNKNVMMNLNYNIEMHTYTCQGNPNTPNVDCGLHTKDGTPTGEPMTFSTKTEYAAHVAGNHSSAYQYLQDSGMWNRDILGTGFWESGGWLQWLIIGAVAIGAVIIAVKVLPSFFKRKESREPRHRGAWEEE